MPKHASHTADGPWQTLASDSASVITTRLGQLPWQWFYAPQQAHNETRLMFSEKQAALLETQWVLVQSPWRFWLDAWSSDLAINPKKALHKATSKAHWRLSAPSRKRVRANQRRLTAGT